jgi:hypothetical protein
MATAAEHVYSQRDATVKVAPLHATGGAWGEKKYSSYSFLTSALEGGE